MSDSELRIEVLAAFAALSTALADLRQAITTETELVAWVQETDFFLTSSQAISVRDKAAAVLSQLQYTASQDPREIIVCAGFVGASPSTLKLATAVNACKDRFKKSILALKSAKISKRDPYLTEKMDSLLAHTSSAALTLKKMGLARLHLKQCYRKIPILKEAPTKISWTWAHTRAIKKITVQQAQALLLKRGEDVGIQIQLQKLSHLNENEALAIVQELAPHLRANLVFQNNLEATRAMIKGPVPIFFPSDLQTPFPKFNPPVPKQGRNHKRSLRSDVRLDPIPYLPAIHAHRYMS